jgi:hypothetical protein
MEISMKQFLMAVALVMVVSGTAFAQAGTPQGYSNNPNPSRSASSNDKSKDPGAVTTGSASKSHMKKQKKK